MDTLAFADQQVTKGHKVVIVQEGDRVQISVESQWPSSHQRRRSSRSATHPLNAQATDTDEQQPSTKDEVASARRPVQAGDCRGHRLVGLDRESLHLNYFVLHGPML